MALLTDSSSSSASCSSSSSRSSSSSFHSLSRFSCSSIRTQSSGYADDTHAGVSYPLSWVDPDPRPRPSLSSLGGHEADSETLSGSLGDQRASLGGYQGDGKSCTWGYQGDRSHGDSVQAVSGRPASMGAIRAKGDIYFLSADVSQFQPHDVVVMAYNHSVVIHAEKVGDDGGVRDKFTHKSLLPEDMDPLSVSGALTPEGMLVVSVSRKSKPNSTSSTSTFHKEAL